MVSFADDGDRFLPIWSAEWPIDMERIKVAKQGLDLPFTVYPRHVTKPNEYERVLAVGSRPPFLTDYALIGPRSDSDGLKAALTYVLGLTDDSRATTILTTLRALLGPEVREIMPDELAAEQKLVAYLTGSD